MHGFLIAGVRRRMDLHHPDESAYDRITKFIGAASGRCFGWIGYDQLRAHSLLDLPDQPEVTVPLPVAHWVEPEGVLAFQGTGSDAQLDWLVSPEPHLAKRMERAIRTVHPVADTAGGPAVSGKSALDAERYRTAFDRVRGHILRGMRNRSRLRAVGCTNWFMQSFHVGEPTLLANVTIPFATPHRICDAFAHLARVRNGFWMC